jgi:hypothetical protein
MTTVLKLVSDAAPWMFESLGERKKVDDIELEPSEFIESPLFAQGQTFELESGKFPLIDFNDLSVGDIHVIGGKSVHVTRFDVSFKPVETVVVEIGEPNPVPSPPKYNSCVIYVIDSASM